jgi:N6-L-threonylcarbamoyladenine synthase
LGGTIDDAAGEAFDKVGAMLGLDFPGGPALSRLAATGDPNAYSFPRPMLKKKSTLNLSFSGLKTAVRYEIFGNGAQTIDQPTVDRSTFADIAASFEAAVVESIVGKAVLAMEQTQRNRLCVGGGVAANLRLRQALSEASSARGFELLIAPNELCTDNAIMGAIAWDSFDRNQFSDLTLDAHPGLRRGK